MVIQIMKEYKLGPNGAIMTALNLFLSQPELIIDTLTSILNNKKEHNNLVVVDIPGQI